MSEENNKPERPYMLEVFSSKEQKQFASNAEKGVIKGFVLDPVKPGCDSYSPGHHFHWIPIFKHSFPRIEITASWLEDKAFEVSVGGEKQIWYHHEPERLKQALSQCLDRAVTTTKDRQWIFIWCGDGCYAFNCSLEPLEDCKE